MKRKFNKYRYLGAVIPEVPLPWESHILDMLQRLDKLTRHYLMPLFLLNFICRYFPSLFKKLVTDIHITQIKQKFGALRIYGTFSKEAQSIVSRTEALCNDTCEFCGNSHTTHVMIKSWVRNLCTTCKEVKKYGTNN